MTDPYATLGNELTAAAERTEGPRDIQGGVRTWLSRRLNAAAAAVALLLAGGAVAVAATGVLTGAPVKPEAPLSPVAGNGLPLPDGGAHLLLKASDPSGGLPWGMRVLHTTRDQVCVQVGRVQDGQIGEIGLDSAFDDDGRFHALAPDILPTGYGGTSSNAECVLSGQTLIFEDARADRSAERLLPEEFPAPPKHREFPPLRDLRSLSYGLLGPHALSVTYRSQTGLHTVPVTGPDGAFLIVEPAGYIKSTSNVGGSYLGQADASSTTVILPTSPRLQSNMISAVTFRFGAKLCSQGYGAAIQQPCPTRHTVAPRRWFMPTRSLHAPVHLALLPQTRAACSAAFLRYPCYKGQVAFTAPYAVARAGSDYEIESTAQCKVGGRPETSWALERDVRRHEQVKTNSLGLFVFTPSCAAREAFQVRYVNQHGPSRQAPHESIIVGTVGMSHATLPDGAPIR